ncbi:hypothetical protein ILUMI_08905 [Ignelater luminosus]|uniref:Transketolase-like pyrimidine-binding domain-containing protein n=1 Tax=Ignelater luminosus TaxID=2038154 RepID=A0A8K0DAD2_IGNLU|nr:hypothetical protein ILUMI_08905 [Ignelater luminosus]
MYLQICEKCLKANSLLTQHLKNKRFILKRTYHSDQVFGFKKKIENKFVVADEVLENRNKESNFYRLVTAFRQYAHINTDINPIAFNKTISSRPELNPQRYGLNESDQVTYKGIINCNGKESGTVGEALILLNEVYAKNLSAEFMYLENEEEIEWFSNRMENLPRENLDKQTKITLATELLKSQTFDNFLANKFSGLKRYGGEGAESMMAFFYEFFRLSAQDTIEQIVIGMPHRGRLNFLTGMLQFAPVRMFKKLRGLPDFPDNYKATGDVLSHCISSTDLSIDDKFLHVTVLYNPSHLEAVNPVSMGKTRAKQMEYRDGDYSSSETQKWSDKILNLQVHGDAAFAGQGINQECLTLCGVPHFEVGGSVHLVVNNQIGFTTPSDRGRTSRYCTDLAKMISSPVLHVNGDDPELVLKAARVAFEYQRKFRKEVFVDMNCYRQWGHNELDDPTFTNPSLYKIIHSRKTVPDLYSQKLEGEGVITKKDIEATVSEHYAWLNEHLNATESYVPEAPCFQRQWEGFEQAQETVTTWNTGLDSELLALIGTRSVSYPTNFNIHPHLLKTYIKSRLTKIAEGTNIDWATAETLAFGSLLYDGYNVRISGQDVGRGTFSHRHVMLVDQETNNIHVPLNEIDPKQQGFLEVANSILSEEAVLGYEYGMSIESPRNLIIWEAQFGDFFNGAQIIFDTFISSGEAKWLWSSGIVILLPHGYDGAGPEHSSSRIERFLQLTDSNEDRVDGDNINMQVCQPSTPAQYFHLLRRQMIRSFRKPLIVIAPKTLLRLSAATSTFADMAPGTGFLPVIGDATVDPKLIKKVIITSGKHYYSLLDKRESLKIKDVALIRMECFSPFPTMELQQELNKFPNAQAVIWSQEEPQNMGAWTFIRPRFENLIGRKIKYSGRDTLPTPAVGVGKWHQEQANDVVTKPFLMKVL